MKIQINSDKEIVVDAEFRDLVEAELNRGLERFQSRLTRIEVHLSDLNSSKPGIRDKRCVLEGRPSGQKPVSVSADAATKEKALATAAAKLKRLLQTSFGRTAAKNARLHSKTVMPRAGFSSAIKKLENIESILSGIVDQTAAELPQIETYVETAHRALQKARSIIESNPQEPVGLARKSGSKKSAVGTRANSATTKKISADGRSIKKKQIYRARRKAWPAR